jgi:hypothetical protein
MLTLYPSTDNRKRGFLMSKQAAKVIFYALAAMVFLWTASLSYRFLADVLPGFGRSLPAVGLIVLDLGVIAWLVVFVHLAEGVAQRLVSLVMCLLCLLGVGLVVAAEILLAGQTITDAPSWLGWAAVWGLAGFSFATVAGVVLFHLTSPENRMSMKIRAEQDALFDASLDQLASKRQAISERVADRMSDKMLADVLEAAGESTGQIDQSPTATIFSANQDGEPAPKIVSRK